MMEDIAAAAEKAVLQLVHKDHWGKKVIDVKTAQIRKFLTAVNSLTNKIAVYRIQHGQVEVLPEHLAAEVKYLKVKIAYQVGRNEGGWSNPVRKFVDASGLLARIDGIGTSIEKYEAFSRYVEALIAYHKYYGGED